jgi:hypothetical protein
MGAYFGGHSYAEADAKDWEARAARDRARLSRNARAAAHKATGREVFYKGLVGMSSPVQPTRLEYLPGAVVDAGEVNLEAWSTCGSGVNFCKTPQEAQRWADRNRGPRCVVEIRLPKGEPWVDAGDKQRARRVIVGDVVAMNLGSAWLARRENEDRAGAHRVSWWNEPGLEPIGDIHAGDRWFSTVNLGPSWR